MPLVAPDLALEITCRAEERCDYCGFPQEAAELPFHFVHIIPPRHGSSTISSNVAWACFSCALRKGSAMTATDPITNRLAPLYHPGKDSWPAYFGWDGPKLRGKSAAGRASIALLCMNHPDLVALREWLAQEGMVF